MKKMTRDSDPRLEGRLPEFATMSLRPGIGHDAMYDVAAELMKYGLEDRLEDVPKELQHGMKKWPLGRYLRRKLRVMVGKSEKTPEKVLEKMAEEMRPLRESAFEASESFASKVLEKSLGKRRRLEARERRFRKREVL